MRVLYLLNFAGKAGTERYVETLVRYLSPDGRIEPYFAYHIRGLLAERLEEMGVPTRQLAMTSRFDLKAAKALAKLCREWDIDLVHCHYLRENYIALLAKRYNQKLKVVYTNHFVIPNDAVTRLSNRWMDRKQDQMIAVCNVGKRQLLQNGWSGEHIQVIFNAVEVDAWAGEKTPDLRNELGIPPERFVMLCASRFAEDKGHMYLLESVKRLTEQTTVPFTLVLAGDGPLLEPCRTRAAELGLNGEQVKFIGFQKDVKRLYKGADLYVNSSQHEALSFLIIEAMAAGLPVIATDMGGNSDIVNTAAGCGRLVEYDNPDSMAGAMREFLEDPAFTARCAAGALRTVREKFEIHHFADATFDVYEKALRG